MPWEIRRDGDRYCIHKKDGGARVACHDSEDEAKRHLAALYANVPDASKTFVTLGHAVKALGGGRVGGYLVQWGSEATKDSEDEWFTPETDFDVEFPSRASVYFHHGQDPHIGRQRLTHGQMDRDEYGVKVEAQLNLQDPRHAAIYRRVERGELGWSSGSLPHVTIPPRERPGGAIKQWPLGHDASLTWMPSDRRNLAVAVKASALPSLPEEDSGERRSLAEATERVIETLETLSGDYRRHAVKVGRKLSIARRERLQHVMDAIAEMLAETDPDPPTETDPPSPVTGEGAEEGQASVTPPPDLHDLYAALCRQEDGRPAALANAIGSTL